MGEELIGSSKKRNQNETWKIRWYPGKIGWKTKEKWKKIIWTKGFKKGKKG